MKLLIFDLDDTLFDSSGRDKSRGDLNSIKPFEGVIDLFTNTEYRRMLVTKGDRDYQNQKIAKLKIGHFFEQIYICPNYEDKLDIFRKIITNNTAAEVIVIGDKLDCEIRYAKILGLLAIQIKHGEHVHLEPTNNFEMPDHVVSKFSQIKQIIDNKK